MLRQIAERYSTSARAKRAKLLARHISLKPKDRVLDLGGGTGDHFYSIFPNHRKVIVADVVEDDLEVARHKYGYETVLLSEDDERLPFEDDEFDVVFCSSVIEHVTGCTDDDVWTRGSAEFEAVGRRLQWAFASEVRRIARRYYVQTPYKYFVIESHSWLPGFIVLLPRPALSRLLRFTNLFWPKETAPDWRLLTVNEFSQMFPGARIEQERSLGLVKSIMAIQS